jgi:hypothetical protein
MVAVNSSATRVARFNSKKIDEGFKRVTRWVFDLENDVCQSQLEQDLMNYKLTPDSNEWDSVAVELANDIEGWK